MSQSSMDPFDEFEFKPLTDGLGFHKKSASLKESLESSGVVEEELQVIPETPKRGIEDLPPAPTKRPTFDDVVSALEKNPIHRKGELTFTETLPRPTDKEKNKKVAMEVEIPRAPVRSPFPQPEAYKSPAIKKIPLQSELGKVGTRRGAADSPVSRKLIPATMSLESALLDFIIVLALSLVFMLALLTVTNVDLNVVFQNMNQDPMSQISLGVMFVAVMQMYVVIARSFFGRTLGEWTFDLQIGEDSQQRLESYPLRVAFRSVIVTVTGLIFLPLLSALLGRDLAGRVSGVQLYRQSM